MKIAIESQDTLLDCELEEIVDMWNRKSRRIAVQVLKKLHSPCVFLTCVEFNSVFKLRLI